MNIWSRLVYEAESIGIPGVHSLGQYNYVAARGGLPPHQHIGCVEISLLVKGHQTYRVRGETYQVKGGEQYISLPGELHDTGEEPQDKGILFWLILDVTKEPDKFLFLAPQMARKLVADLLAFPNRHFAGHREGHATLEKAFTALGQARKPDDCTGNFRSLNFGPGRARGKARDKSSHLLEAASHLVYYLLQTIAASKMNLRQTSPIIQSSLDYIASHSTEWLSIAQVASSCNLSESYFKMLFREEVGVPPAEYMIRQKIEAAKTALNDSDASITDVAYSLGFSSSQYFATVFKRFTNQTPSEFMNGKAQELDTIIG